MAINKIVFNMSPSIWEAFPLHEEYDVLAPVPSPPPPPLNKKKPETLELNIKAKHVSPWKQLTSIEEVLAARMEGKYIEWMAGGDNDGYREILLPNRSYSNDFYVKRLQKGIYVHSKQRVRVFGVVLHMDNVCYPRIFSCKEAFDEVSKNLMFKKLLGTLMWVHIEDEGVEFP
jgi:hypothetical protein